MILKKIILRIRLWCNDICPDHGPYIVTCTDCYYDKIAIRHKKLEEESNRHAALYDKYKTYKVCESFNERENHK